MAFFFFFCEGEKQVTLRIHCPVAFNCVSESLLAMQLLRLPAKACARLTCSSQGRGAWQHSSPGSRVWLHAISQQAPARDHATPRVQRRRRVPRQRRRAAA